VTAGCAPAEDPVATSHNGDDDQLPVCAITGSPITPGDAVRFGSLRAGLAQRIRQDVPAIQSGDFVDRAAVADYRGRYVEDLLKSERGEITALERDVVDSLRSQDILSTNVEDQIETERTFGERLADRVAEFGGSWTFIMAFFTLLAIWMAGNVLMVAKAFDPYPFILLNLILSCIAAIQAPIIMMSQKRQEAKDRRRSENDFRINLKAELEIRHLHEKIDHLLSRQWERLAEMQTMQIDLLQDLRDRRGKTD
jgi:uncharacterized membrane protein